MNIMKRLSGRGILGQPPGRGDINRMEDYASSIVLGGGAV